MKMKSLINKLWDALDMDFWSSYRVSLLISKLENIDDLYLIIFFFFFYPPFLKITPNSCPTPPPPPPSEIRGVAPSFFPIIHKHSLLYRSDTKGSRPLVLNLNVWKIGKKPGKDRN